MEAIGKIVKVKLEGGKTSVLHCHCDNVSDAA